MSKSHLQFIMNTLQTGTHDCFVVVLTRMVEPTRVGLQYPPSRNNYLQNFGFAFYCTMCVCNAELPMSSSLEMVPKYKNRTPTKSHRLMPLTALLFFNIIVRTDTSL